jgi:putative ABC transport system permease protein
MALGAQRVDVLRLVLGQSLIWTLVGVACGLAAAFGLLRFLDTLLYGIKPADPVVLGAASVLLVVVSITASYLPARRAMGIDAVRALREG